MNQASIVDIESIRPPDLLKKCYDCLTSYISEYVNPATGLIDDKYAQNVRRCPACRGEKSIEFVRKEGLRFVACTECNTIYQSPVIRQWLLHEMYADSEYSNLVEQLRRSTYTARKYGKFGPILNRYQKLFSKGRVLETGCSCGYFLDLLKEKTEMEVEGVEANEGSARFCCEELGLKVYAGDLRGHDLPNNSYDVICSWGTMVHFSEPEGLFDKVYDLLKPGGTMIMSGPITSGFEFVLGRHQLNLTATLVAVYSGSGFRAIAERSGFSNVRVNYVGEHDVSIVRSICKKVQRDDVKMSSFLWRLLTEDGAAAERQREAFQGFLSENELTTYVDFIAEK
jgi:2-polyprenyl-3-methyl-5-hydroxy-6-metoxy-1,4-benzoquinol methylase